LEQVAILDLFSFFILHKTRGRRKKSAYDKPIAPESRQIRLSGGEFTGMFNSGQVFEVFVDRVIEYA
jgi:hypothetical protein